MSKYIIELNEDCKIVQQMCVTEHGNAYTNGCYSCDLEELNSDYINEHFGELQDEAYQKGINDGSLDVKQRVEGAYQRGLGDAWKLAEDVIYNRGNVLDILHCVTVGAAFDKYSAEQAMDILKAYEGKCSDRIEVGDEVICTTDNIKLIVTSMYKVGSINWCDGVAQDGKVYSTLIENNQKTGKHYDIASILEAMRK